MNAPANMLTPLQGALNAVALGLYVAPVTANAKAPPMLPDWENAATNDAAQVNEWATAFPNCNWLVAPGRSSHMVLDLDRKNGKDGVTELERLAAEHGFEIPDTLAVATPHGFHIYLDGASQSSVSRIAPGIDVRSNGGYVLAPGSVVDGLPYTITHALEPWDVIPPAPAPMLALAGAKREAVKAAADIELDQPHNIARARAHLQNLIDRGDVATEGRGGDARTYELACEIINLGHTPEKTFELMLPWNAACHPPWDHDELRVKIENASQYSQNEAGAWAVPPASSTVTPEVLKSLIATAPEAKIEQSGGAASDDADGEARLAEKFRVIRPGEFHLLKPPTYLIQNLLSEMAIALIYGPWGTFKTFVLIEILAGIAGNVSVFGKYAIKQSGSVILAAAEQPNAAAQVRFPAWCKKHGLLVPNVPFHLMRNVPLVQHPKEVIAFVKSIKREKINPLAIGIDTLTRAMGGLDMNAPQAGGLMTNAADYIKDELGCSVIMTGHMGKDKSKKSFGSIVVPANCDAVFEIDRPLPKGPAIIFRNEKLKEDDTNPDIFLCSEKFAGSIVLNPVSEAEYKKLIAKSGPGADEALAAEINHVLRIAGFIGSNVCGYKEMLNLVLSERGELEGDAKTDDKARERLRGAIRRATEQGNNSLLALGRKVKGTTGGLQWSAVADTPEADDGGYLGGLDDA